MSETGTRRRPRMLRLVLALAMLAALVPVGAALGHEHHTATRVEVTFTSTPVEVIDPGEQWVDEAGITHVRGMVEADEITGDLTGTAEIAIRIDAHEGEGWVSGWGTVTITDEAGTWTGHWIDNAHTEDGEVIESGFIMLTGRGGNSGMSIAGSLSIDDETGVGTIEGDLQTMATPLEGLNVLMDLCFNEDGTISGGFLASGAIEGSGSAEMATESAGGIWTHTYNLFGVTVLTNEHGSVAIAFLGGAQDGETYSGAWGPFMTIGGEGAYAELYGYGRTVATALDSATCASGTGVRLSYVGVAHYNSASEALLPVE